ncbi:MAG: hypothetical protein GXP54_11605 [Deltaproteobacteria bacterium]|nr:hypothetical protein [Deltaproteobacteria bacterium]
MTKKAWVRRIVVGTLTVVLASCSGNGSGATDAGVTDDNGARTDSGNGVPQKCVVDQPFPYLDSPYPGIHGNMGNNERIACEGPVTAPTPGWSRLVDRMIFNPMTVGTDRIYAVVIRTQGCKLWTVSLVDGEEACFPKGDPEMLSMGVLGSSPELDQDGNVYVTDGWMDRPDGVFSFDHDGNLRWHRTFEGLRQQEPDTYGPPLGLHFTADGDVATVAPDGLVVVLAREADAPNNGIRGSFDIVHQTNLRPLKPGQDTAPAGDLPPYLGCRMQQVFGEELSVDMMRAALSGGTGGSGAYTDNTIAASGDLLFVVGGGPDHGDGFAENGALVAIRTKPEKQGLDMELAWYMQTNGPTGSSPTVSPDGRWVVVSDVTAEGRARIVTADVKACEAAEGKAAPACAPAWTYVLEGGPLLAHLSIDEDGVVYAWNQGADPKAPDLVAVSPPDAQHKEAWLKWGASFPSPRPVELPSTDWTSTVLVLDNSVVGTVTHAKYMEAADMGLPVPIAIRAEHELVGVRRSDGKVLWRNVPMPDAAINSPTLGPDGNIYVPIFGFIDFAALPDNPLSQDCADASGAYQGGVVQFVVK